MNYYLFTIYFVLLHKGIRLRRCLFMNAHRTGCLLFSAFCLLQDFAVSRTSRLSTPKNTKYFLLCTKCTVHTGKWKCKVLYMTGKGILTNDINPQATNVIYIYIYMELLVKPEMLTSYIYMDLRLATLKQSLSLCCTMFQH